MATQNQQDHVSMMTQPQRWPNWPWLPVKKWSDGRLVCAVVYADNTDPDPFVIHSWAKDELFTPSGEILATYASAQAAVDDGWVVD